VSPIFVSKIILQTLLKEGLIPNLIREKCFAIAYTMLEKNVLQLHTLWIAIKEMFKDIICHQPIVMDFNYIQLNQLIRRFKVEVLLFLGFFYYTV
jgi:hypothetical protein